RAVERERIVGVSAGRQQAEQPLQVDVVVQRVDAAKAEGGHAAARAIGQELGAVEVEGAPERIDERQLAPAVSARRAAHEVGVDDVAPIRGRADRAIALVLQDEADFVVAQEPVADPAGGRRARKQLAGRVVGGHAAGEHGLRGPGGGWNGGQEVVDAGAAAAAVVAAGDDEKDKAKAKSQLAHEANCTSIRDRAACLAEPKKAAAGGQSPRAGAGRGRGEARGAASSANRRTASASSSAVSWPSARYRPAAQSAGRMRSHAVWSGKTSRSAAKRAGRRE